jgi:hypothetical protein
MINYYYELADGVTAFGREEKYVTLQNIHPGEHKSLMHIHDQAVKHSTRVWLENANGVTEVKSIGSWNRVNPKEFVWIKLRARELP